MSNTTKEEINYPSQSFINLKEVICSVSNEVFRVKPEELIVYSVQSGFLRVKHFDRDEFAAYNGELWDYLGEDYPEYLQW